MSQNLFIAHLGRTVLHEKYILCYIRNQNLGLHMYGNNISKYEQIFLKFIYKMRLNTDRI